MLELKWDLPVRTHQIQFKMVVLVVRLVLIIYSLFNAFICCWSSMHLNHNETDRLSLLAIKTQIKHDPHQVMDSWNASIHFCQWQGVLCSRRHHQRVTVLNLQSQNLVGSISPHIGNLSFLKELHLQNNSFSHQIPPQIGHLRRLQVLHLHNNSLTGPIPPNISNCFNLIELNVGHNYGLVGKIPSELGSLSKLQIFVVQQNKLTGEIPPSLGNLSSLQVLAASYNNLLGSIPSSLGQLKILTFFGLSFNMLSGTIPPPIYNFSALQNFGISRNQIQGSLPTYLGNTLPNLQYFEIYANQFIGSIPSSISNVTSLLRFVVDENKLSGQVPDLRKLHNLIVFMISDNNLGKGKYGDLSFLSDLSNATELRILGIGTNNFGGKLPASVSNISSNKLAVLGFEANQLHGSIPIGIGNLVNLRVLAMASNHFTGSIPTDIGKLQRLEKLDIDNNQLSESIPTSLGNLTMLTWLELQGNNLEGRIPSSLGKCQWLLLLDLSHNNLTGEIPQQVVSLPSLSISLKLSTNRFTGPLPTEVGKLKSLTELDVSNNMLSGELPGSLGSCLNLEILYLQGNFFEGSIPLTMISLKGIQYLDLSRNNLSGEIPQFLKGFVFLKNLNLSFNAFWGAVPIDGVFKNASGTSIVGNTRLCGGILDLQLPKCKSKDSSGGGLSLKLKLIISVVSGLGIAMVLSFIFLRSLRRKRKETALSTSVLQVSYSTLLKATDGFSSANLIGVGSFGSVYKGVFDDDGRAQVVAVKVFNMLRRGASKSFIAECEAIRNIRHRNLVKIITVCSSVDFRGNDFKALVYEFMDKGSLEEWLHPSNTGREEVRDVPMVLNLVQRLVIAIDVACALDYLHNQCETPIVHCDIKPSNVLLDNELTGHVSDFGLATFLSKLTSNVVADHQTSSIGIKGSVGYAAPEYGMGSEVSTYGDVYSFGILLLEMFTGKRPTDNMFSDGFNLHNFVKEALPERVIEIADSLLAQGGTNNTDPNQRRSIATAQKIEDCLSLIFRIGIACSAECPTDRKHITDVTSELHSIRCTLLG